MKGTVTNGTLSFEVVYYVEVLNHSLLSVSHICDKSFSTHFTNKECLILNPGFVVPEKWILIRTPRINNAYIINMNSDSFTENTCLFSKASKNDHLLWHRRLGHINLKNLTDLLREIMLLAYLLNTSPQLRNASHVPRGSNIRDPTSLNCST